MKIKDLKEVYPEAYERALKNQYLQENIRNEDALLSWAFSWQRTKEGDDYWFSVFRKNFDQAKQILKEQTK